MPAHKKKNLTRPNSRQQPFYVIVINVRVEFDNLAKNLEEDRMHTALTHLLSRFLSENQRVQQLFELIKSHTLRLLN